MGLGLPAKPIRRRRAKTESWWATDDSLRVGASNGSASFPQQQLSCIGDRTMITCRRASRLVSDAMDTHLDDVQSDALAQHLQICADCRNVARQWQMIRLGVREWRHGTVLLNQEVPPFPA
jgi:hypothetical protein